MSDLPKRLRIKADMIRMGEKISYGTDSALMDEAADEIERLREILRERTKTEDER